MRGLWPTERVRGRPHSGNLSPPKCSIDLHPVSVWLTLAAIVAQLSLLEAIKLDAMGDAIQDRIHRIDRAGLPGRDLLDHDVGHP